MDKQYTDDINAFNFCKTISVRIFTVLLAFYLCPWAYWYLVLLWAKLVVVIVFKIPKYWSLWVLAIIILNVNKWRNGNINKTMPKMYTSKTLYHLNQKISTYHSVSYYPFVIVQTMKLMTSNNGNPKWK